MIKSQQFNSWRHFKEIERGENNNINLERIALEIRVPFEKGDNFISEFLVLIYAIKFQVYVCFMG